MFQLSEFTEAHVASVTNRQETHGDEKVPAVSIGLDLTCTNTIHDHMPVGLWSCVDCGMKFEPVGPYLATVAALTADRDSWADQASQRVADCAAYLEQIKALRKAAQSALDALKIGRDSAAAEATRYHAAMAGYRPARHTAMDADVAQIDTAIEGLRGWLL